MFYNFLNYFFNSSNDLFNLNSLLLRSLLAFILAFILSIIGLKYLINYLKSHSAFQPIRVDGPKGHLITKQKTPTIGGIVLAVSILVSSILFCNLKDIQVISVLIISMSFSVIGLIDDTIKVFYKNTNGFKGSIKLILQILICGIIFLFLAKNDSIITNNETVFIPFIKISLYIGILLIPFLIMVIVGSSNAVNITDGLDGLAIIPIMISLIVLGILCIASVLGDNIHYLKILNDENPSELAIICSAGIGTCIAFFIYNKYPAKIFMGDVGSLMYGALLGSIAVMLRYEILYGIIGLLFVIEAASTTIQIISYKLFKKRIFRMAPIHHHFEKLGWSERKVVLSFWAFSFICCIVGILGIINFKF